MNNNKLKIINIAWRFQDSFGVYEGNNAPLNFNKNFIKSEVFANPFKNFGRLDDISKSLCVATALSLQNVGLYPSDDKLNISLLLNNEKGSYDADFKYFKDFLDFDEKAARANLFLYTLPTSPLGELSVHFGLTGDIAYIANNNFIFEDFLKVAEEKCEVRKELNPNEKNFFIFCLAKTYADKADAIVLLLSNKRNTNIELNVNKLNFDEIATFIKSEILNSIKN